MYHISDNLQEFHFGTWNPSSGLYVSSEGDIYDRRSNLQGTVISASSIQGPPMTAIDKETGRIMGFVGDVWAELELRMNFRTELKREPADSYGALTKNGTWTGMIALLVSGDVEVAVGDFTVNTQRAKAVDFTVPVSESVVSVYVRWIELRDFDLKDFLAPFSKELWITAIAVIFTMSLCLAAIRSFEHHEESRRRYGAFRYLLHVYSIFCQQGVEAVPGAMSCRLVYVGVYFTAVTLCAAYSATLVSSLAVQTNALPFKNFQQMLKRNDFEMGVVNNSAVLSEFEEATDPILHQVYSRFIAHKRYNLPPNSIFGLNKVCENKKYAFVTSSLIATYTEKSLSCYVVPLPEAFTREYLSLAVAKNSAYLDIINHNLLKLRHDGSLKRFHTHTWPPRTLESDSTWHSVDIFDVMSILIVLAAGTVMATVFLAVEILHQQLSLRNTGQCRLPAI
ncbi:hypothetical protein B7P43_G07625 [Cryptotermes secundus]|uniref:Ionotropic glutamate receptor C-terminal domain-containing protein n=2 Tax=Cryptotermes secundus TaxID=105785 RepID=A0A2J7RLE2_9NEOP|nr:hypothetical protein B7P43_G07625 [Cryptotermes secundus]